MFDLNHDYHIHTTLSTCCGDPEMTPAHAVSRCAAAGFAELVITNHFWDAKMPGADDWYAPQDLMHVQKALPLPQAEGVKVRFGCETEFCGGSKIGISPESYGAFDFIIVPFTHLHNNFSRPVDCVSTAQVAALYMDHFEDLIRIDLPWRKVGIAHLTCQLTYPGPKLHEVFAQLDDRRLRPVFRFLADKGAGIELNAGCFRPGWEEHRDTFLHIYRLAGECGCKFYCGSDAHALDALTRIHQWLPPVAETLGLTEKEQFRI